MLGSDGRKCGIIKQDSELLDLYIINQCNNLGNTALSALKQHDSGGVSPFIGVRL